MYPIFQILFSPVFQVFCMPTGWKQIVFHVNFSSRAVFCFLNPWNTRNFCAENRWKKKWDYKMYLNISLFISSKITLMEKMNIVSGKGRSKNYFHMIFPHNHQFICDFFFYFTSKVPTKCTSGEKSDKAWSLMLDVENPFLCDWSKFFFVFLFWCFFHICAVTSSWKIYFSLRTSGYIS